MSTEIVRNPREGEDPVAPPIREDGSLYPYAMRFDGDKYVAFADSPEDLVTVLIPGYDQMESEDERAKARILLAVTAQVAVQAQINASTEVDEPEAWAALSPAEREALTSNRVEQPHGWGEGPLGDVWESSIPIVLVETGYAPYTPYDVPMSAEGDVENPSNIYWLRPAEEWDLLESLNNVGYVGLSEAI